MRRVYKVTIKMVKEISMDHEQESMEKALADVRKVIEHSTKDGLNQIFSSKPKFIYRAEIKE